MNFSLRNFPLYLDQILDLKLNAEDFVDAMSSERRRLSATTDFLQQNY